MVKFIDIQTGNTFNGDIPYIHWFEGQFGVNLIYTKPICFLSSKKTTDITISQDSVFKLLNLKTWSSVDNFIDYNDIKELYSPSIKLRGTGYKGKYIYLFYVAVSSDTAGEFVEDIYLNDERYQIGVDIYSENESLYINLSNNGISIPDSVQKAIYPVNIHEDYKDCIVLNRKWKELLSNYWEMMANRGSYKSLLNTLNWFEWGDTVKLYELWKSSNDRYCLKEIQSILRNDFLDHFSNLSKTTYLSLISALEEEVPNRYDDEKNPLLEKVSHDWSIQDLSLKMAMLGNFYETYFMPIHLDLIHSTIANVVYTNTFKLQVGITEGRVDQIVHNTPVLCNIDDDREFYLNYVNARVYKDTLFANKTLSSPVIIGVDVESASDIDQKLYLSQRYNDIGCIIPIKLDIPNHKTIYKEYLTILKNGEIVSYVEDNKYNAGGLEFNILLKEIGDYTINIQLHALDGEVMVCKRNIKVLDTDSIQLNTYKIVAVKNPILSYSGANNYLTSLQKMDNKINHLFRTQYLKISKDESGIKLSNVLILKGDHTGSQYIDKHYFTYLKNTFKTIVVNDRLEWIKDDNLNLIPDQIYTICISKKFWFDPDLSKLNEDSIYKNEMMFIPHFHTLIPFGGNSLNDYIVSDKDTLCIIPSLKHGKHVDGVEWVLINDTDGSRVTLEGSVQQPIIAGCDEWGLTPGYYSVKFKYKLHDDINEVKMDSIFILKR